ncbi:MAG TPA: FixH family protein [Rhodocyclaceae bacterium]|nr:FixH family protein [Rhodocyclaceae bacterium]
MRLQSSSNQPWYKEPWPWILMTGPLVVVIAGFITAWLAIRSNDGLVADDYYKQGLAINQQLHRDQKADDLGLRASVMRSGSQLRVMLTTGTGQIAPPEKLSLRITHPTRAGMDQTVTLVPEGPSMFSGKLEADISGRWHVVLEDPSGQWRLQGDWQADAAESFQLLPGDATSITNRNVTGR